MKSNIIKSLFITGAAAIVLAACSKRLDLYPQNDLTPATTYSTAMGYKQVLAKIYGGLSSTGNVGPAGASDIQGLDEGSQSPFIRGFFNHQELPTDEAVVAWNDQTIQNFHSFRWTPSDPFILGMYARPIYNITVINEYLREATDAKLSERGIVGNEAADIRNSTAEVRFLRAYNYWVMMDLFGKSTFITEENLIGTDLPGEIERPALFNYIETELLAIENEIAAPRSLEYGRADKGAVWALLARMYLNAEVYTGTARWTEAMTYAQKVINSNAYTLSNNYGELFMADNEKHANEIILAVTNDGLRTQSYGNTTFFVHAASGDDHSDFGVGGGWYGYRATNALGYKFEDRTGNTDQRALFTTSKYGTSEDQMEIDDVTVFDNGLHVNKYRNIRSDGGPVSDVNRDFSDVDFPLFRLPEMYLIYAEAALRGGGDLTLALDYMNRIRFRAYRNSYGPGNIGRINAGDLNPQLVLDERARELYWEGHRRTDLVRYNQLTTGAYLWPWKGGVASGTAVNDRYNLYPIPAANLSANPNLTQNPKYQ